MAFLYMLECEGNTLYTGIAKDFERRLRDHCEKGPKCAKYTRSHPPRRVAALSEVADLNDAAKGEYAVKRLRPEKKRRLAADPEKLVVFCPALAGIPFTAAARLPELPQCGEEK